jgi:hypothetical protein
MELQRVTGKFDRGFERKTARACDFEAKISSVALRQKRESEKENAEVEQFAHDRMGNFYAISFEGAELSY